MIFLGRRGTGDEKGGGLLRILLRGARLQAF